MVGITILINGAAFILCIGFFVYADLDNRQDEAALPAIIMLLIVAIVNFINIVWKSKSFTWLSLYFERKAGEERKKIRELEKSNN